MEAHVQAAILLAFFGYVAAQTDFGFVTNGRLNQVGTDQKASLATCEKYCGFRSSCASFDYHWPSSTCRHHGGPPCPMTSLLLQDGWTHHEQTSCSTRVAARQASVCSGGNNLYFIRAGTASGGFFLNVGTLSDCLNACTANVTCQHVVWNFQNGRTCFGFSSQPAVTTSSCCYFATRVCSAIDTTTAPITTPTTTALNTTTASTTTRATVATTTFITPTTPTINSTLSATLGSSGKCPDPFVLRNGTTQSGGAILNMNTTEQTCLALCFADATCGAAIYSYTSRTCVKVTTYTPASTTSTTCCALYFKNDCTHRCYSLASTTKAVADTSAQQITLPTTISATLAACAGDLCQSVYTLDTATMMYTVTYGCSTGLTRPEMLCSSTTTGTMTTSTCVCRGLRCNALTSILPTVYWPLDCHTRDFSGFLRDGEGKNGLTFDRNEAARNWSASFNGSTGFVAPNTANIVFGDPSTTSGALGSITVTFWMKRTEISGGMGIIGNGLKFISPVEVRSNMVDHINHQLMARFRIGTANYFVTGNGYMFLWHFVAVVLRRDNTNMITTELYVTNPTMTTTPTTVVKTATVGPVADPAPTVRLNLSNQPFQLGSGKFISGISVADVDFYKGFLDEVYIFNSALSMTQLQALVDQTRAL